MVWNDFAHAEHLAICQLLPQQSFTEIPVSDRNVLLDHYLRILPIDCHPIPSHLLEDGNLGRGPGSRPGGLGIRAILRLEIPMASEGARGSEMDYGWASDFPNRPEPFLCIDPYSWNRWVRSSATSQGSFWLTFARFIAWWYYVAPSHNTFAIVRRTMTLTNLFAFVIFIFYPCMPPRLLPPEYGFLDSVGRNNGQSVWMKGRYVNSLAAMPSMHFGYSFCIGCTMMYHSGLFRKTLEPAEIRKSTAWQLFYALFAIAYPSWILITIIATANHYFLDACVAVFVAITAFLCNRVFLVLLPVEDLLMWCLRLEKPIPTTGVRYRARLDR